jgi:hypothetical protein
MAGDEEYGKAYPRFGSWVRYLEDGGGWFEQSVPQALADQIKRHVAVLEAFGLMDIPVYVVFTREHFGWGPGSQTLYTYRAIPCGASLHPLVNSMAIEYSSGAAAAVWEAVKGPAGEAIFTYRW